MEPISLNLQPFFEWLWRATLQASLLICLVLMIQLVLGTKLGVRWRYCLWLLLLLRMALPWAPQSRLSLSNVIPQQGLQVPMEYARRAVADDSAGSGSPGGRVGESTPASATKVTQDTAEAPALLPDVPKEAGRQLRTHSLELADVLPLVWLAGALILGAYVCANNFTLLSIIRRQRPLTEQKILELLEDCKSQMGIRTILGLVVSNKVKSPALFGFVRPRLLLPAGMLETLSREELRYVFLHELGHLKRHDIYLGWLTSILQVLHWFNPLIWLAFYRMRADRELACDALVLARTQSGQARDYGRTIVSLLERFSRSQPLPAMAGILETKTQLKRRIKMIAQFKKNSYQWSPLAVALIIIVGCISLPEAPRERASAKHARQTTLRQVWSGTGVDLCGAPSPDGRYLSYVDWETGDLAIYEIATGKKRRLTNKGSWDESVEFALFSRWSPDSKQIVYDWYNENDFVELRIIGLDGSKPRILNRNEKVVWAQTYDWSQDGKQILACFSKKEGPDQIVLVSVADGSVRVLKTLGLRGPRNMRFSPDGRYIIYDFPPEKYSAERDISLLPVDGGPGIPLIEHPADDIVLGWTPDGKNILFASDRTGNFDVWAIQFARGKPQGVPELVKRDIGRRFLPLGFTHKGSFYYGIREVGQDVYIATLDPKTGKIVVPPKKAVKRFEGANIAPYYSPDGKYLAYISRLGFLSRNRSRRHIHCIRTLETGKERDFTFNLNLISASTPRWSPDCRWLLARGTDNKNREGIFQVNAQTGDTTPVVLFKEGISGRSYEWSPDGNSVFYTLGDGRILVRELETGTEDELYRLSSEICTKISVSPDGKWLALRSQQPDNDLRSLKVMPVTGGEPRELCKFEKWEEGATTFTWTADGGHILFASKVPGKNDWELCRIPADGGEIEKLGLEMLQISRLSVHPDGQHIAFQSSGFKRESAEVWVMENFLPGAPVAKPEPTVTLRRVEVRGRRGVVHSQPSFDGNYMSDRDRETGNLVVRDIATGKERMLTKTDPNWFAYESLISPENKRVAFLQFNPNKEDFDLQVIGFDGTGLRTLLGAEEIAGYFNLDAWSPDGRYIFGRLERKPMQLVRVSADDGSVQVIKTFDEKSVSKVNVSLDGRYVAYDLAENKTSNPDIFVFDLEENRETPLVKHPANDKLLGWTPDGQHVFFTSDRNGTWDGWLLRVEDGKPRGLPEVIKAGMGDVSPIGFTRSGSFYYNFRHEAWNVYTAKLDLDTGEALSAPSPVRHVGKDVRPDWSPDGQYLAYCSEPDRNKPQVVRIRTLATDRERQLKTELPHFDWLRWCPDSRHLLITNFNRGSPSVVYKLDVQTGEHTALVQSDEQQIRQAELSADGKTLAYRIRGLGNANWLIVRDMETGREKELLRSESMGAAALLFWALSPDGKHVALSVRENEVNRAFVLKIISVASGEARTVVGDSVGELAWINDGRDLLFAKGFKELWRVSAEGGEPRKLWEWKQMLWGLRIHPDGQRIAFFSGGNVSEMWVMENILPTGE